MARITANRFHTFCYGHRVVGHEGHCRMLHGHEGCVHFYCEADSLDELGRVIDFSVIKEKLCMWLEDNWDHKFLYWEKDNLMNQILSTHMPELQSNEIQDLFDGTVKLSFNPTAENLANHLLTVVGPVRLKGTGVRLVKVVFEETRKCSVTCELGSLLIR